MPALAKLRSWLFRFGQDVTQPIILTQRRIYILPTSTGLLFGVVLAVMLIGAINYTLSLGHALVFLLAGLGLVTMVHTFRNLAGLSISSGRAEPVFAGDTARFPLHLANSRPEARRALAFRFGDDKAVTVEADIPAHGSASLSLPCVTTRRGILDPGRVTLATRYPLGLFRAWSYPHPVLRCIVYPQPIERPLPPPTPVSTPGQARGLAGQEDFAGLRVRTPSDPPRHIAWKAVARNADQHPLLVRQFAGGAHEELWLRWELTADEGDLETRISVLAGWVLAADDAQLDYGLALPGITLDPAHGSAHRDACLEALALLDHETTPDNAA